jgi:hypothetical protein
MPEEIQALSAAELEEVLSLVEHRQPLTDEQLLLFAVTVRRMSEELVQKLQQRLEVSSIRFAEPGEVTFDPFIRSIDPS